MFSTFEKGCQYSLQPDLNLTTLKKWDFKAVDDTQWVGERMHKQQIFVQIADDSGYHRTFHTLKSKPYLLYLQWEISLLDKKILGVVWPRESSVYATEVMNDFFNYVQEYDLVTISGGAQGVDTACHELSLDKGIPTIIVLGAGFVHYLRHHRTKDLLKRIVEKGGLVISQFKLFQEPTWRSFPSRNRLIAGLSNALFLPAAGQKSGSLLTVDFALEMGTPIYSVTANIYDATSQGTNSYIEQGKIRPIVSFTKMLDEHFVRRWASDDTISMTSSRDLLPEEQAIVTLLAQAPQSYSQLCHQLGRPIEKLLSHLTWLEMEGMIGESQPGVYTII